MEEYLIKISVLKDALAVAREKLKEYEVILLALGGLGNEYKSFVTSITTWFDHSMSFATLKHLLMDQVQNKIAATLIITPVINYAAKSNTKSDARVAIKST